MLFGDLADDIYPYAGVIGGALALVVGLYHQWRGSLGDNFMIYGGLVGPEDIFDSETAAGFTGLVFFGDNFAGDNIGFDTRDGWQLVGLDTGYSPVPRPLEARTVAEFFEQRIAEYE